MVCNCLAKVHADFAMVNVNVWLAPDSANLGSAQTGDEGGLTVFHAKPPGGKTMRCRRTSRYFVRRADGMRQYSGERRCNALGHPCGRESQWEKL